MEGKAKSLQTLAGDPVFARPFFFSPGCKTLPNVVLERMICVCVNRRVIRLTLDVLACVAGGIVCVKFERRGATKGMGRRLTPRA